MSVSAARAKIHGPSGERMDCLDLSGFRGNPQRLGRNLQKLGALLRLSHGSIPSSAA